jgi:hypothetical protein
MYEVGPYVPQDPRVVGDQQDAGVPACPDPVDAFAHHAQRVDVQPRVGLVEDRDLRLQQLELHDLVPLLLAAGEALVDVALGEVRVHAEALHRPLELGRPGTQLRRLTIDRRLRGTQEVRHRHTRHLDGILHREEQPGAGALVDRHAQHVDVVERHRTAGDLVLRVARDGVRERRLARAVGAHDGVGLPRPDGQRDTGQDRLALAVRQLDRHVQVTDIEGAQRFTPLLGVRLT